MARSRGFARPRRRHRDLERKHALRAKEAARIFQMGYAHEPWIIIGAGEADGGSSS